MLRTDGIGWEEWKTDDGLERLSQTMPHRYGRDGGGHWRCPPGEHFAAHFGLLYRLRSSSEIDWVLHRNLRFLEDYLAKPLLVETDTAQALLAQVERQPYMQLAELLRAVGQERADAQITVNPGCSSGWHSHPGGAIIVVQEGSLTVHGSIGSQCETTTYSAGQAFIERPGEVDDVVNTGVIPYVLFVTFPHVPQGESARIDTADPGTCPGSDDPSLAAD